VTKNETAAVVLLVCAASGCSTSSAGGAADDGGGTADDATVMADAGPIQVSPVPGTAKAICAANPTACLTGTAATPRFTAKPAQMKAALYRVFPFGTERPLDAELVAGDGTWVFAGSPDGGADAGLDPWAHYYVQIEADFNVDGGATGSAVTALAGPLTVPSAGEPIALSVPPIQLSVLESRAAGLAGATMQLRGVLAHVFDPSTGAEVKSSATVMITVGGTPVAVPWSGADGGMDAYSLQFTQPTPAQPTYTVTVASPPFGPTPATFQLVAVEPAFDGAIVSPDGGAPVPAGSPLPVVWAAEPQADYEIVQIFTSIGFASVYVSPQPDPPDEVEETVEAGLPQGSYLLNVSYSKTNCPATADGCVQANTVSAEDIAAN
jgi:hypothetical protein